MRKRIVTVKTGAHSMFAYLVYLIPNFRIFTDF